MKNLLYTYCATLITLGAVDLAYLGTVGAKLFKRQLGPGVLRDKPRAGAAILFYILYTAGIVYFSILPNVSHGLIFTGMTGALIGLLAYGTYDLTNMATLAKWTWTLVVADLIWGIIVTGIAAGAGGYVLQKLT